jgi:hypothetical protein
MKKLTSRIFPVFGLASSLLHCSTNSGSSPDDEASSTQLGVSHGKGHCHGKGHDHGHGNDCGGAGAGGAAGAGGTGGMSGSSGTAGSSGTGGSGGGGGPIDCFRVAPDGDDTAAASNGGQTPFRSVQVAIDFADTHRNVASSVCVAAGGACGATAEYPGPASSELRMRNGISVVGKYESTGWTRCADSVTRLLPQTALGVLFGAEITAATKLQDFDIVSIPAATTAAVTVDGALDARLEGISMPERDTWPGATPNMSLGVDAHAGSGVTVAGSDLFAPPGLEQSIGIFVTSARLIVEDSRVRARGPQESVGIRIDGTPASRLSQNELSVAATGDASGVLVAGIMANDAVASLLIEDNEVTVVGMHQESRGISLFGSVAGGTEVLRNFVIVEGLGNVLGFTSNGGGSPAVIDNEVSCVAGGAGRAVGIECRLSSSACSSVRGNLVHGTVASPSCAGSCPYELTGMQVTGQLGGSTVADSNRVEGGCTHDTNSNTTFGILAGGGVRVENNVVTGSTCVTFSGTSIGMRLQGIFSEQDVNSNYIDGGTPTGACSSAGVLQTDSNSTVGNNIILAGHCSNAANVDRIGARAMSLTNNDFVPGEPGAVLARTPSGNLTSIEQVNALPGSSGNFVATCTLPLDSSSACVDAGNPVGAPDHDIDGEPRSPTSPDVGPDEWGDLGGG